MNRMRKARQDLEQIQKEFAEIGKRRGTREFTLASERIGEALQHFDHAIMLIEDVAENSKGKAPAFFSKSGGGDGL
jgi:hypothetical protein